MYRMRNTLIILISVVLMTGSCKKPLADDHSLTVKEYQQLGMPDPSKTWSIMNCIDAHITLSNLWIKDPESLPRRNSKKSSVIFKRIVNPDVMQFLDEEEVPLNIKAMQIQKFAKLQNDLTGFYSYELNNERYYKEELPYVFIYSMSIQDKMLELAGQIMDSKEMSDKSFQSGLQTVVYNYLKLIGLILEEQTKSNVYQVKDLNKLCAVVSNSLKENHKWISPEDKKKLRSQLQNVIDKSTSGYILKNYKNILKIL